MIYNFFLIIVSLSLFLIGIVMSTEIVKFVKRNFKIMDKKLWKDCAPSVTIYAKNIFVENVFHFLFVN